MKTPDAVKSLAALAQDSRLAVFRLLVQQGPSGLPAGAIAERLELPPATLSFHLKELANARLVRGRQEGRYIYYAANFETMNALLGYLTENCCQGSGCLTECAGKPPAKRRATA
jgi:DNA-binding transcriptional ArsR family regulator